MSDTVHIAVGECTLFAGEQEYPLSRFEVGFALDNIPRAVAVPALGRPLEDNADYGNVKDIEEGQEVEIKINVNGKEYSLISGKVQSLASHDNSGLISRTMSVNITISHQAVDIAGSASSSFVYVGNGQSLNSLIDAKAAYTRFGQEPELVADLNSDSGILGYIAGKQIPYTQTTNLLFELTKALTKKFRPTFSVEEILIPYQEANVSALDIIAGVDYIDSICSRFLSGWQTNNCWTGLQQTAQYLFLRLVPYNKGIFIGNPMGFIREPQVTLTSSEFISMRENIQRGSTEPIEGVYVALPIQGRGDDPDTILASFPALPSGQGTGTKAKINKYYSAAQFPAWMYGTEGAKYGRAISGGGANKVSNRNRGAVKPKEKVTNLKDRVYDLGERVAKAAFSSHRMRQAEVSLIMPFRVDLMPGTLIKIDVSDQEDLSFIGDVMYGMVHSLTISGSMLGDGGELTCYVNLTHVRNEKDNQSDDLTFSEHPIYKGLWKAIDINGEQLKDEQ